MRKLTKVLSLILTLILMMGLCAQAESKSIIDLYNKPDAQAYS